MFDTTVQDIDLVKVLSKTDYTPPMFIKNLFNIKINSHLSCIILFSGAKSISLLTRDTGFEDLKIWLSSHGWNLRESIEESLKVPLVRVDVARGEVN